MKIPIDTEQIRVVSIDPTGILFKYKSNWQNYFSSTPTLDLPTQAGGTCCRNLFTLFFVDKTFQKIEDVSTSPVRRHCCPGNGIS